MHPWNPSAIPTDTQAALDRDRARLLYAGVAWIVACLLLAVVCAVFITGPVAVVAVPLAVVCVVLIVAVGVGPVPGSLWAIGLAPFALLLLGGRSTDGGWGPPSAIAGVGVVVLAEAYGWLIHRRGDLDLWSGPQPPADRTIARNLRRPHAVRLVGYTALLLGADVDVVGLAILACFVALLWRRSWTGGAAAVACAVALVVQIMDGLAADPAHALVLTALTVHWVRASLDPAWRSGRLRLVESGLRGAWRTGGRLCRVADTMTQPHPGGWGAAPDHGAGQSWQYCFRCVRSTPHDPLRGCVHCVHLRDGREDSRDLRESLERHDFTDSRAWQAYEHGYRRGGQ